MVVGVEQRDWELLNQQLRGAGPPQTGLAGVVMFAVFFSGLNPWYSPHSNTKSNATNRIACAAGDNSHACQSTCPAAAVGPRRR